MPYTYIRDILENKQKIVALAPNATVSEAIGIMAEKKIGAMLVMEGDKLLGIFTERDLLSRIVSKGKDATKTMLKEVMTPNPDCFSPDDRLTDALDMMRSKGYRHLPIVRENEVVSIISIRDLYASVQEMLEKELKQVEEFVFTGGRG